MTITCEEPTATIGAQSCLPWGISYVVSERRVCLGSIQAERDSATRSVMALVTHEEDLNPYEFMRSGRVLAFWDDPKEDVYSLNDGEPV